MIATRERRRGHYEILETPYAKDYVWVPGAEPAQATYEEAHPWHAEYEEWTREERAHPERQQWAEIQSLN